LADNALIYPLRKKRKRRNGTRTSAPQNRTQSSTENFDDLILFFAPIRVQTNAGQRTALLTRGTQKRTQSPAENLAALIVLVTHTRRPLPPLLPDKPIPADPSADPANPQLQPRPLNRDTAGTRLHS
jgi:hypothetical protein